MLRTEIAHRVNLKFAPDIRFRWTTGSRRPPRSTRCCARPRCSATSQAPIHADDDQLDDDKNDGEA